MQAYKTPKTRQGAMRQYDALIRSYQQDFAGGGAFGWDWQTFNVNSPDRCRRAKELLMLARELPSHNRRRR